MGCMSSKHLSRSISFKAKLSQSFGRLNYGEPEIEGLKTSGNGSDQLLAFIYSATTNKVQDGVFRSDSKPITSTELSASPKEAPVLPTLLEQPRVTEEEYLINGVLHSRSKSCHSFSEQEIKVDITEWGHKGISRARSFHTVEEFDALLERIRLSRDPPVVEDLPLHAEGKTKESQVTTTESSSNEEAAMQGSSCSNIVTQKQEEEKLAINGESKRKAIAKGLSPIIVPSAIPNPTPTSSTIEFLSVPSLRDWVSGGSNYYTTPKFGSYALPQQVKSNNDEDDDDIINPELVATFEDCMRQLEAEEENIIQQFADNQDENTVLH